MKGYYFDEHMRRTIARALIEHNIHVVMAVDVGMTGMADSAHLDYATQAELVMVTFDRPFATRTMYNNEFYALVCLSEAVRNNVGAIVLLLTEFANLFEPERDQKQVFWLP